MNPDYKFANYQDLLKRNEDWAKEMEKDDKEYFPHLSEGQKPKFLWIGCSDSRVPVNEITGTHAGEIFVHRNIANMVVHTDLNLLSVLEYAVNVLKVEHIIVCGHYGCGGVKAAMGNQDIGLINKWLRNIKEVYRIHEGEIGFNKDSDEQFKSLVRFNAQEQVLNLAKTSIVQKAWKNGQNLNLHGWVFNMEDGRIQELEHFTKDSYMDPIFHFDFE